MKAFKVLTTALLILAIILPASVLTTGADSELTNYALALYGAKYEIVRLDAAGNEKGAGFLEGFGDDAFIKLTDGVTSVGEKAESSVSFAGTGQTHIVKFDLGQKIIISKIVLRNVISREGWTNPVDYSAICKVSAEGKEIKTSFSEKLKLLYIPEIKEEEIAKHNSYCWVQINGKLAKGTYCNKNKEITSDIWDSLFISEFIISPLLKVD